MADKLQQQLKKLGSKLESLPSSKDALTKLLKCSSKDSGSSSTTDLIGSRIKVWWPLDKEFYEGEVKSFDSQKRKHVVLYDDGDVEVLRLENERWELVKKDDESETPGLSKGSRPKVD